MINQKHGTILLLLGALAVLVACGPSTEEPATMTAVVWTPTPTTAPSPTPVPYGVSLQVNDADGNPIEGALVTFTESDAPRLTGADGLAEVADYPSDTAAFTVEAQGYVDGTQEASLERGPNNLSISLDRDPYGLLPSEACGPGEGVFAVYDFEDGSAVGWPEIEFLAQGWSFVSDQEAADNVVLQLQASSDDNGSARQDFPDNFAWRFRVRAETRLALSLTPSRTPVDEGMQFYHFAFSTGDPPRPSQLIRGVAGSGVAVRNLPYLPIGEWTYLEISRFEDTLEVWQDGVQVASYQDTQPLPASGFVGIGMFVDEDPSTLLFDNMSICGLSSAFSPIFPEAGTEE